MVLNGSTSDRSDGPIEGREAVLAGLEFNPDAVAVFEGSDLVCGAANAAMRALIGRDLVGSPLREAMADLYGQEVFELFEQVMATGVQVDARAFRYELETPDGSPWEVYVNFALAPWPAEDGSTRGVLARAVDVTSEVNDRIKAEEQAAADRARLVGARAMITSIQDALLPSDLPVAPGLDISARYLLADDGTAGGDWFDAVIRPDGTVALAVGDVVGHGVEASATMGQLRAVLRHGLLSPDVTLTEAFEGLNRFARSEPAAVGTTACVVQVDAQTGRASYVSAGHPPPLVIDVEGAARFALPIVSTPLGRGNGEEDRPEAVDLSLGPGDLVMLYTDGLLERPGTTVLQATVDLARVAGNAARDDWPMSSDDRLAERVCEVTLELLTRLTGHDDDITVLAAQLTRPPQPLFLQGPVGSSTTLRAREASAAWLAGLDVNAEHFTAFQHAVSELVSNVVDHAYGHLNAVEARGSAAADAITIEARLEQDGVAVVVVTDRGRWRPPATEHASDPRQKSSSAGGGRGLAMVSRFTDAFDLEHDGAKAGEDRGGTTATFRMRLGRSAMLSSQMTAAGRTPVVLGLPFTATVRSDDEGRVPVIAVTGPVDPAATRYLHALVERISLGGTEPVRLDLADVTHLGSRAVQLLFDHPNLRLVAPVGSVAQHVLQLVGLPSERP